MIPPAIQTEIGSFFSREYGTGIRVLSSSGIGGGCINDAAWFETSAGKFFIKYNLASRYPDMFEKEALGLKLISGMGNIRVPEVVFSGTAGEYTYLVLEYIEQGTRRRDFWDDFGRSLAALHRNSAKAFGLDLDNYMGSLRQSNRFHDEWHDFFISERLEPLVKLARDAHEISSATVSSFENLYLRLPDIIPREQPALLHGDLWGGNFMVAEEGKVCLIDPAVYYGHRESDIAMTKLFGGFTEEFYTAYNDAFPLEKGWQQRIDILNLYPLLIHVNLFGGGYTSQVKSVLSRF